MKGIRLVPSDNPAEVSLLSGCRCDQLRGGPVQRLTDAEQFQPTPFCDSVSFQMEWIGVHMSKD